MILGIDPGDSQTAYVLIDENYKIIRHGKIPNEEVLSILRWHTGKDIAIEMIASYGMPVGKEVFDTCVWIGRYIQVLYDKHMPYEYMYRKEIKLNLCGDPRAKDANIIRALKNRFGDRGTKKNPGWFYQVKADEWQAYAVAVTYLDKKLGGNADGRHI